MADIPELSVLRWAGGEEEWRLANVIEIVAAGGDPEYVPAILPAKTSLVPEYLTPFQAAVKTGRAYLVDYYIRSCRQSLDQLTVDRRSLRDLVAGRPHATEVLLAAETTFAAEAGVALGGPGAVLGCRRPARGSSPI